MLWSVKISSVIIMVGLIIIMLYLAASVEPQKPFPISTIEINGNIHLPKDQYFMFANLNEKQNYENLDISIVRDRISKHPFVKNVFVKQERSNLVIDLLEKRFEAILFANGNQYLIDENLLVVPVLPFTQKVDYPIINNPLIDDKITALNSVKHNIDVLTGLKIITAAKLLSPDLFENLSEIDLRNGKDILIHLSSVDYPIVVGRGSEITKMVYFARVWESLKTKSANNILDYIDLRFRNHIYLGVSDSFIENRDNAL